MWEILVHFVKPFITLATKFYKDIMGKKYKPILILKLKEINNIIILK